MPVFHLFVAVDEANFRLVAELFFWIVDQNLIRLLTVLLVLYWQSEEIYITWTKVDLVRISIVRSNYLVYHHFFL